MDTEHKVEETVTLWYDTQVGVTNLAVWKGNNTFANKNISLVLTQKEPDKSSSYIFVSIMSGIFAFCILSLSGTLALGAAIISVTFFLWAIIAPKPTHVLIGISGMQYEVAVYDDYNRALQLADTIRKACNH